jgi:hypothetical protein
MSGLAACKQLQTTHRHERLRSMGRKMILTIGSLLLGAVALAMGVAGTRPEPMQAISFHGSRASLTTLSAEAAKCGLRKTKIERIGRFLALTVYTAGITDESGTCLVRWVLAHPEAGIGFLGNQAFANERKS